MPATWTANKLPMFPTVVYELRDEAGVLLATITHHDVHMSSAWAHARVGDRELSFPTVDEAVGWVKTQIQPEAKAA